MNRKKMRPLSTKSSKKQSAKFHQKWWLAVILAAILIGYLVWRSISPDTETRATENPATITEPITAEPSASVPLNNETNDAAFNQSALNENALNEGTDPLTASSTQTLDPKAILNAPLPETDSLAKEEIDRLEDERKRLAEQEKLAAEQLAMNKELTNMKAEQIALLEKQIAQLETNNTDETSVE
ncbi:hypothetical protein [Psychrobacter vallis]|uniref:hypothetical protein n=1 Tax=Psychrobacter vallis TaxID=248451 RepID=UPI00191AD62D|nr:hypothetical protein [Psychrobacter vallis]